MASRLSLVFAVACMFASLPTVAQRGNNSELLKRALAASAKGQCPPDLMSPMLQGACEQQMPGMGNNLAARGPITGTEFIGIQQTPTGPAEVYRVRFEHGPMMWMISTGPDGKIVILWSNG